MELNQTEQQLFLLKGFLKKYSKLILFLMVFFLVIFLGGGYWNYKSRKNSAEAAQIFQEVILAEYKDDNDSARAKAEQLVSEYSSTPYAKFANLMLAKMAVKTNNLDIAAEKLRAVINRPDKMQLAKHLAIVRLAGVLQQQGKFDEALDLVSKDPESAYLSLYAQARGDVYAARGDLAQAKLAYKLALQSLPAGTQAPVLQLKFQDVGGESNA